MAVGSSVPLLDAEARVRGNLPYAADLRLPDMLHARILRSPYPHARIAHIEASEAAALPGVAAIVTRDDFGHGGLNPVYGSGRDETVVAIERVRFIGEPVALVAAETEKIAEAALDLIRVDYQELPAVFDAFEALQAGAPVLHPEYPGNLLGHSKLRHGDLEAGFAEADEIIEETYSSPLAQQSALEQQVSIGQWLDGKLRMWTASQSPFTVRREVAHVLGLEPDQVQIIVPPLGGGFGGKGNVRTQPHAAALARKVGGRPVRLMLSREEEFVTVTKHAVTLKISSGVRRDGRLTARLIEGYWNAGAYASSSKHLLSAGMLRSIGPYRIPNVKADCFGVYTNLPPAAAYRGAMSSQGAWAHESHMDSIAHRLGMDPLELRRRNTLRDGDRFATGETVHDVHFMRCLEAVAEPLGWGEPFVREPAPRRRRGRGLAVMMKHTISTSRSQCALELDASGRLTLFTSSVEMGQGAHTTLAQICADEMGLRLADVAVNGPDTALSPFDSQTASSRTAFMMGNAVRDGANALKHKFIRLAAPLLEEPPEGLAAGNGVIFIRARPGECLSYDEVLARSGMQRLRAEGSFQTEGGIDPETGQGIATPHWHQGAGACEVEIDLDTGKVTVLRYYASAFAGKVINPELAKLQNDGNVIHGLGPTFMEEMVHDSGQILNANLSDYRIPSLPDLPGELGSVLLESEGSQIHGLGEMTLPPVAPAIGNAIFDALQLRIRDLPITPEKVLRALVEGQDER